MYMCVYVCVYVCIHKMYKWLWAFPTDKSPVTSSGTNIPFDLDILLRFHTGVLHRVTHLPDSPLSAFYGSFMCCLLGIQIQVHFKICNFLSLDKVKVVFIAIFQNTEWPQFHGPHLLRRTDGVHVLCERECVSSSVPDSQETQIHLDSTTALHGWVMTTMVQKKKLGM